MSAEDSIDLRRALEKNEIIPFFQPLVELRTGMLCGFEVLARWKHPLRGIVLPDEFIPLAERTGLNGLLTGNLLRTVFAVAKDIPDHLTLSVNISLTQLTDRTLPKHIFQAAEQANFPLHRLILEITETALIANTEHAYFIANELKHQGARLALDDFGTGYSSLRHLQALPFDELKIDASFVRSMTHTRESRKIAAAIIGLGNSLNLVTVAEGIENQTHADMLLWLGCDLGQGWLYGRPVPSEELPTLLVAKPLHPSSGETSMYGDAGFLEHEALPTQRLAQLHAIYDGVPVGLCFLDHNLRYVSINKRLAAINKTPIASHLGRTVAEVVPRLFPLVETYLRRALAGEPITGFEIREPAPDQNGLFNTYLVSCQPARDEADEVIGVSCSVIDITRRKQAEEALAESEDHYRHTVELNSQITWTASPGGMIIDFNQQVQVLTGRTREQILGDGWTLSLHPDDYERTIAIWNHVLTTGDPLDIQFRFRRHDGVWRWMHSRAAARKDQDGNIIRWYGILEDIDDYRKTEDALRISQARLQAIYDAVPVGIVITDGPDNHIVMYNKRAQNILGCPGAAPDTIKERLQSIVYHPDGSPLQPHEHPLERATLHGETTTADHLRYKRNDGTLVDVCLTAAPVRTNGKITGSVVTIQELDENESAVPAPAKTADRHSR